MISLASPVVVYTSHLLMATSIGSLAFVFKTKIESTLSQVKLGKSNLDYSKENMTIGLAASGLLVVILVAIGLPLVIALVGGGIAYAVLPNIVDKRRQKKYIQDFEASLTDSLDIIASSLKAGLTLKDSLVVTADNCKPVFAREISRVLKEYRFGVPLEESLDGVRKRIGTDSANISFGAIIIGNQLGGNLPEILKQIVVTIRERNRVEGRLKTLTSQGRAQAFLMMIAPPALAIGMYFYDPVKMSYMTDTLMGKSLLALAVILEIIGIVVTKKVMELEI